MEKVFIILYKDKPYCGMGKKQKTVKAYTERGIAQGIVNRDVYNIASEQYNSLDIKHEGAYQVICDTIKSYFRVEEVEV